MTPELQKPDTAPKTPRVIPLTQEEQTMAAMTAINMNLAALLESQQKVEKLATKQAKDVTSIKAATTFFLILGIIAMFPLFATLIRTCVGL